MATVEKKIKQDEDSWRYICEGFKQKSHNPILEDHRQKMIPSSEVGFQVNVLSTWQDKNPGLVGLWTSRTGFGHGLKQSCPVKLIVNRTFANPPSL